MQHLYEVMLHDLAKELPAPILDTSQLDSVTFRDAGIVKWVAMQQFPVAPNAF